VCITLLKHNSMPKSRFYQLYAVHSGKEVIEFWCILCSESFSDLRNFVQKYIYWFASTYICELSFSVMKVIKNKQRLWLKNGNMQNFTTTNLTLDSNSFATNIQQQNLVMKWWEFLNVNSKFLSTYCIRKSFYFFVDVRFSTTNSITLVAIKICPNY